MKVRAIADIGSPMNTSIIAPIRRTIATTSIIRFTMYCSIDTINHNIMHIYKLYGSVYLYSIFQNKLSREFSTYISIRNTKAMKVRTIADIGSPTSIAIIDSIRSKTATTSIIKASISYTINYNAIDIYKFYEKV